MLIGFGLSGCSFNLVIAAFGKLLPERYRMLAIGAGTAAGSFGQFLFAPFGVALIDGVGWQHALLVFGGMLLLIVPLALALATPRSEPKPARRRRSPATQSLDRARSPKRSATAPTCCWCSASSPAASSSRSSRCTCRPT